mmetsp:Transcript_22550/g.35274  ORF Transcript_22550/g.35274 Transcript_22550/m.35274 type:complete len:94 (+) Transcript_22550:824-1105(+)
MPSWRKRPRIRKSDFQSDGEVLNQIDLPWRESGKAMMEQEQRLYPRWLQTSLGGTEAAAPNSQESREGESRRAAPRFKGESIKYGEVVQLINS